MVTQHLPASVGGCFGKQSYHGSKWQCCLHKAITCAAAECSPKAVAQRAAATHTYVQLPCIAVAGVYAMCVCGSTPYTLGSTEGPLVL